LNNFSGRNSAFAWRCVAQTLLVGALAMSLLLVTPPAITSAAAVDAGSSDTETGVAGDATGAIDENGGGLQAAPDQPAPIEDQNSMLDETMLETSPTPSAEVPPIGELLGAQSIASSSAWGEGVNKRISGADRFATAAAVSAHAYPSTAGTVIVVSGENFPDALSAAALSAKLRAPLLPVFETSIPSSIASELDRLQPKHVIVVGGSAVVSSQVESAIRARLGANVTSERVFGDDRYATSAEISKRGWPQGSSDAFIATGVVYADALAAGAAAGKLGIPVLLVPGTDPALPRSSSVELERLGAASLRIAGGDGSVSPRMRSELVAGGRSITQYAGIDRFETSAKIVEGVFEGYADTYWANGSGFADALTGAAAAGSRGAALLLVEQNCVPSTVYRANDRLLPAETFLLGGAGSLSDEVLTGNECQVRQNGISESDWRSAKQIYASVNQERYDRGLGGLRLAHASGMAAAQSWVSRVVAGTAQNQPDLGAKQPWVRYQVSAVTSNGSARALDLMRGSKGTSRWMFQPNAGIRGFVGIGYASLGAKSGATMFFGAGL